MRKILIVDDHDDFREGVKDFLKKQKMDLLISESSSAEEAIAKALFLRPDIILMDIRLPNMNGIEASNKIKEQLPNCKIIILTDTTAVNKSAEGSREDLKNGSVTAQNVQLNSTFRGMPGGGAPRN